MSAPLRIQWPALWLLVLAAGCTAEQRGSPGVGAGDAGLEAGAGLWGSRGDCSVVEHVEVPLDLFGALFEPPSVLRWGERFALISSGRLTQDRAVDVAIVSWQGVSIKEHLTLTGLCPDDVCTNVLGVALLATAAGKPQLVLADEGSSVSMPSYPLRAEVWDSGQSGPLVAPLFDSHVAAITTRAAMKSSRSANRALFALGNIDQATLQAIAVGENGVAVAPAFGITLSPLPWDCLAVVPTSAAGAISAVAHTDTGTELLWHLREIDAEASTVFETTATIPVGDALGYADCPTIVDGPDGFYAQWVNVDGESLVASLKRDAEPSATPELTRFDVNPGVLSGIVGDTLLFQGVLASGQRGFARIDREGAPSSAPIELPALPESTLEHRRALPQVLSVEGTAVNMAYELETARVLEELRCP